MANSVILTRDELYARIASGMKETKFQVFNTNSITELLYNVMDWNDNDAREITEEDIMLMEDKIVSEIEALISSIIPV